MEQTHPVVESISESVYASGIVKSRNQYQAFSTVSGIIHDIFVSEGDLIKKGDPLISVRNDASRLSTQNARLAAAHADVAANKTKLEQALVAIDLAMSKMKEDSLLLIRQQNLHANNVGTRVELEQRELAYRNSLAQYQVALLTYSDLKRDLAFSADQSKTNLEISKVLASDYIVRAEADGKVYKVLKERGELANPLSPVAVLGDSSDFLLELSVDEYDIANVRMGQHVFFNMDSYKGKVYEAVIEKIEPLMDQESRSFIVKAAFISRPPELFPNLSVEANIIIRTSDKTLTIPRSYLIGDSVVLIGKNKTRRVVIGIRDYRKAEVLSGLTEKDIIYKSVQ
ncbi:MAG TPA: efflux RND transporter periplasmic adaptor subunit [Cyclobacteriaceae bacterium]|nr:efflux RND transporter periplasmic adaptor subunit [Cyclobacteriaceae bacterium]